MKIKHINSSHEPFTNWAASVAEDIAVIGGLWTALHYPWLFLVLMIFFLELMIWLLPKIWRGIKRILVIWVAYSNMGAKMNFRRTAKRLIHNPYGEEFYKT